jgi:hypothetical protein
VRKNEAVAATALTGIRTALDGIGHVIRDRPMLVPPFQRPYAWKEDEVATFWWDLRAAFSTESPEYFLGTIVLTSGAEEPTTIIDGQQRLATAVMLFAAIRNEFLRHDDIDRASVVERNYVASRDLRSGELRPRISLNPEDAAFFQRLVIERPGPGEPTSATTASNRRLEAAFQFLTEKLGNEAGSAGSNWGDLLIRWIDFLEKRVRVISVDVATDADAFLIFETLNDRGLDLTVADLLRNYLFGLGRDFQDQLQRRWQAVVEALESTGDENILTTFIRHYWSSQHGATRERELYAQLRQQIRSAQQAKAFVDSLEVSAPFYAALLDAEHPAWTLWPQAQSEAQVLLDLGLEQNRPLILSAMARFDEDEFPRLLKSLIAWSVRGLIVGGIGGGTTERYYAEAATGITSQSITDTAGVYESLLPIIPADEDFRREFAQRRVIKTSLAKYYLAALAALEDGNSDPAIVVDHDEAQSALVHVLPRRAVAEDWPGFPSDEIGQWALRLGNQFLVSPDCARSVREAGPERAATVLAEGRPVAMTTSRWTTDDVDRRQSALADLAVQVWPREPQS